MTSPDYDFIEDILSNKTERFLQHIRCFLNTHHWYTIDVDYYGGGDALMISFREANSEVKRAMISLCMSRVTADRLAGKKIWYKCRACKKRKQFG